MMSDARRRVHDALQRELSASNAQIGALLAERRMLIDTLAPAILSLDASERELLIVRSALARAVRILKQTDDRTEE